jgi:hypothetical protein
MPYLHLYFCQRKKYAMAKNNDDKKGRPIQKNPEPGALEKEIDELIQREKAKRRIVSKLVHQSNSRNKKSDN